MATDWSSLPTIFERYQVSESSGRMFLRVIRVVRVTTTGWRVVYTDTQGNTWDNFVPDKFHKRDYFETPKAAYADYIARHTKYAAELALRAASHRESAAEGERQLAALEAEVQAVAA